MYKIMIDEYDLRSKVMRNDVTPQKIKEISSNKNKRPCKIQMIQGKKWRGLSKDKSLDQVISIGLEVILRIYGPSTKIGKEKVGEKGKKVIFQWPKIFLDF